MEGSSSTALQPMQPPPPPYDSYVKLRIDPDADLVTNLGDSSFDYGVLWQLSKRDLKPLTDTSYRQFFFSKANMLGASCGRELVSMSAFALSHIPSVPWLQTAVRGVVALDQLHYPFGVLRRFGNFSLREMYRFGAIGSCVAAGLILIVYNVHGTSKDELFSDDRLIADWVFYSIITGFFTMNFSFTCSNTENDEWDRDDRFKLDQIEKALERLPHLKTDPRLTKKDDAGNPITLPAFVTYEGSSRRGYYQLPKLLELMKAGKMDRDTLVHFDMDYFRTVLDVLKNPMPQENVDSTGSVNASLLV